MKALITDHVNKKLSLVEREQIPSVEEHDDVIVRMICAGVCGTDISILHGKQPGTDGIVNGHEVLSLFRHMEWNEHQEKNTIFKLRNKVTAEKKQKFIF